MMQPDYLEAESESRYSPDDTDGSIARLIEDVARGSWSPYRRQQKLTYDIFQHREVDLVR